MLIHFLKTEFKDKKFRTINLLQRTLDMLFGTFLRQIQFSNFEFEVHDRLFKGNVVNSDTLSNLFFQLSSEYGSNVFDTFKAEKNNFG
jgi:oligoendopeptidase F